MMAWARSMAAVGFAYGVGDMACQRLESRTLDQKRTAEFAAVGSAIIGPLNHGYELVLERRFPGAAVRQVLYKVVSRMVCAPVFLTVNFASLALVRNRDAIEAVRKNVVPAWATGTFFWPAVSLVVYRYVPLTLRPAVGSVIGAVWSTYLSFMSHRKPHH